MSKINNVCENTSWEIKVNHKTSFFFSYIELDREVLSSSGHVGVQNMEIREDVRLSPGDEVVIIGFGSGLPMKIDTGATVFANDAGSNMNHHSPDFTFHANFDTFGGNSGSGVFKSDGTLIGIHFQGSKSNFSFHYFC